MYLKSEFSDLIIVCKGREFAAHKFVVCQRSEHLNGLCESHQVFGFLKLMLLVSIANTVSLQNPSKPLVINREPILIEKTLEFLYQADYTVLNATPTKNFKNLKAPRSTVASSIRTFRKAQLAKLRAAEESNSFSTEIQNEEDYQDTRIQWSERLGMNWWRFHQSGKQMG